MSNLRKKCGNSKRVLYPTYNNYCTWGLIELVAPSLPPAPCITSSPQISDLWGKKSQKLGWYFSLILSLVYDNTARLQLCLLLSSSFHPPSLPPSLPLVSNVNCGFSPSAAYQQCYYHRYCTCVKLQPHNMWNYSQYEADVSPLKTLSLPSFLPSCSLG